MGSTRMRGDVFLGSSYLRVLLYLGGLLHNRALFFTVTISTELLSVSSIIVSLVRLSVRLSFLLLIWNRETVDIFLYDIKKRFLPILNSEANCYNACYGIRAIVPFYWNYFLESRQHISKDLSRTGYNLPPEETDPTRTCPWLL